MTMNIDQAADDLFNYILTAMTGVPAALKAKLRETLRPRNHAHVAVVMAAEIIYKNRATLPAAALTLGANLAEAADLAGAGGLNNDRRGYRIGTALRRMPGVEQRPDVVDADPTPLADDVAPPVTP